VSPRLVVRLSATQHRAAQLSQDHRPGINGVNTHREVGEAGRRWVPWSERARCGKGQVETAVDAGLSAGCWKFCASESDDV
jgi:hypothetical protein